MLAGARYKYRLDTTAVQLMADDSNMVQIRVHHLSGDSKDGDKLNSDLIIHNDEVILPVDTCGTTVKDGASVVILDLPLLMDQTTTPYQSCENEIDETPEEKDPWDLPALHDDSPSWRELDTKGRIRRVLLCYIGKPMVLLALLYFFICSLDLLSSSFRLLGGKAVGEVFASSELLQNPVAGLMIGILATVTVQSSSTSTSIVITMVAAGILPVRVAIPIIMGANIGTSVTNTIVAMTETANPDSFRLAFAGATVHDMFNWLAVLVLLPIECATGYLYHLTTALVNAGNLQSNEGANRDFLKKLTKPFTSMVIQLDKKIIEKIALGQEEYMDMSLVKRCGDHYELHDENDTLITSNETMTGNHSITIAADSDECPWFVLQSVPLSDTWLGLILLLTSLLTLCLCLVLLVKVLKSVLCGRIVGVVKKIVNADFCGAGLVALLVGAVLTMLVQSSSIFTSVLTPLVGMNVIKIECMYPLTLGSNIGTTGTGILAAMAASGDKLEAAMQIALVHLFFNISGIILFYPIPQTRIPIQLAKIMGNTTAKYRWFAAFYLIMMFVVLPLVVFGMSLAGSVPLAIFLCIVMSISTLVIILNILQRKIPKKLPVKLRTWEFLPFEWMHSLDPLDRLITKVLNLFTSCCPCKKTVKEQQTEESEALKNTDSVDSESVAGSHRVFIHEYSRTLQTPPKTPKTQEETVLTKETIIPEDLEKKLEAEQAANNWDVESGYGSRNLSEFSSRIPTTNNSLNTTPSQSVMPSRAASVLDMKESKL